MRPLITLPLLLALLACDAPEVVSRAPPPQPPAADPTLTALLAEVDALKARLAEAGSPVDILVSLGHLNYEAGRYVDAIDWYRLAAAGAEEAVEARAALAGVEAAAAAPEGCAPDGAPGAFDRTVQVATGLSQAGARPGALACLNQALAPLALGMARRGAAWTVIDEPERALADLRQAMALTADDPEVLYLIGAGALGVRQPDPAHTALGRQAWERFLALAPDHPRAAEVGRLLAALDGPGT